MKCRLALLALLLCNTVAQAEVFIMPFAGYSFGGDGMGIDRYAEERDGKAEDSFHGGVILGYTDPRMLDSYLLYSHQQTDLLQQADGTQSRLDGMSVDYWHTGGTLYFSRNRLRPYITGSAGLTRLKPDNAIDATQRFSMSLGAGLQLALANNFALMADLRGYATFVGNDSRFNCQSDQQCLWYYSGDTLWQGQANVGVKWQF